MTKNKIFIFLLLLISALFFYLFRNSKNQKNEKEVHFHAGFLVYLNGKVQNFSDSKWIHIEPCTDEKLPHKEDEQLEKAHLHDGVGDVVHVHRQGAVWEDLFQNIGFTFPDKNSLKAYSGGNEVNNFLSSPIIPYDSLIIVSGDIQSINLSQYVTYDHIKDIESNSESCGN